jgi:hypothetical protein
MLLKYSCWRRCDWLKRRRGSSVNVLWTSRNKKTGHAKIISEGDILNYKNGGKKIII